MSNNGELLPLFARWKDDYFIWRWIGFFFPYSHQHMVTTVFGRMYLPNSLRGWTNKEIEDRFLGHELIHIEQQSRYTTLGFLLLYLFLPIPFFFAYFRWKFEREAYKIDIESHNHPANIDDVVEALSRDYFFPWPKSWMRKWFIKNCKPTFKVMRG